MAKKSALFVCLGNICRSPIAEACFKQLLKEKGMLNNWVVDSAATSQYEIGSSPDRRGQACMIKHNIYCHVEKHRARQVKKSDFDAFDYIFGMDKSNIENLQKMAPNREYKAKLFLLGKFRTDKQSEGKGVIEDPYYSNGVIEDPYYSNDEIAFEDVYKKCLDCCHNFITEYADQ